VCCQSAEGLIKSGSVGGQFTGGGCDELEASVRSGGRGRRSGRRARDWDQTVPRGPARPPGERALCTLRRRWAFSQPGEKASRKPAPHIPELPWDGDVCTIPIAPSLASTTPPFLAQPGAFNPRWLVHCSRKGRPSAGVTECAQFLGGRGRRTMSPPWRDQGPSVGAANRSTHLLRERGARTPAAGIVRVGDDGAIRIPI